MTHFVPDCNRSISLFFTFILQKIRLTSIDASLILFY